MSFECCTESKQNHSLYKTLASLAHLFDWFLRRLQLTSLSSTNRMLITSSWLGQYNSDILPVNSSNRACLSYDFLHPRVLTMVLYQQVEGHTSVSTIVYSYTNINNDTIPYPFKGQFELSLIGDNVLIQTVVFISEYGIVNRLRLEPTTCSESGELQNCSAYRFVCVNFSSPWHQAFIQKLKIRINIFNSFFNQVIIPCE